MLLGVVLVVVGVKLFVILFVMVVLLLLCNSLLCGHLSALFLLLLLLLHFTLHCKQLHGILIGVWFLFDHTLCGMICCLGVIDEVRHRHGWWGHEGRGTWRHWLRRRCYHWHLRPSHLLGKRTLWVVHWRLSGQLCRLSHWLGLVDRCWFRWFLFLLFFNLWFFLLRFECRL